MTSYQQVIPYVDRMDYVAAMTNEMAYVVAVLPMRRNPSLIMKKIKKRR